MKAVLVDVDNTIFDFALSSAEAIAKAAADTNVSLPDNILSVFLEYNDRLWSEHEKGMITQDEIFRTRWREIFRSTGIKDFDGYEFEQVFLRRLEDSAVEIDGIRDALLYLKEKGYMLCIASNASEEQQAKRLRSRGLQDFFCHIFTSGKAGVSKPDPAFFEYCAMHSGISLKDTYMLGDSLEADIKGAKKAGLKTIWLERTGSLHSPYADYIIKSPDEIMGIL